MVWRAAPSVISNSLFTPKFIISSAAVYLPLLRMMPPTFPSPRSISVFSRSKTRAPACFAVNAAAQPAQPPPITTILTI